jgi:lipopolysaccharide/colanic/teichoic acid biosynthesis glycosyltransferase
MLLAPILLIIAIAIKLESHGAIFVRETKYGHDNRSTRVSKFRTTFSDVERKRMTHVGQIVHNTGIDELPQLFDVLRGDLSIVGRRNVPCFGKQSIGNQ